MSFIAKTKRTFGGAQSKTWKAGWYVNKQEEEELGETAAPKKKATDAPKKKKVLAGGKKEKKSGKVSPKHQKKLQKEMVKMGAKFSDAEKAPKVKQPKRAQIYFSMTDAKGKVIVAPIKVAKTGNCINKCAILKEPKVLAIAEPGPAGKGFYKRRAILEFAKSIGCKCCDYQVFLRDVAVWKADPQGKQVLTTQDAKCKSACDGTKKIVVPKKKVAKKKVDPNAPKKKKKGAKVPKALQQKPSTKKTKVVKGAKKKPPTPLSPAAAAQKIKAIKNTKPDTVKHLTKHTHVKKDDTSLRKDFGHRGGVKRADTAKLKAKKQAKDAQVYNPKDPKGSKKKGTKGTATKAAPAAAAKPAARL